MAIGYVEHKKWKEGKKLTRKQAMIAQCYECNGESEGGVDCEAEESCPLYPYMPYSSTPYESGRKGKPLSEEQKRKMQEGRKK